MTNKGILFFAHNNEEIDYTSLAMANALLVKKYFNNPHISLISDRGSINYLESLYGGDFIDRAFNNLILEDVKKTNNIRRIRDTYYSEKHVVWNNSNRVKAFDLSPYDETLVLDVDYLIQNNILEQVFGNPEDFLMNHRVIPLLRDQPFFEGEKRLNYNNILQYWATVFYFKKSKFSERLFGLAEHIYDNYNYYRVAYGLKGNNIRNDYIFSIVNHMMSGFYGAEIKQLPIPYILSSSDYDTLWEIRNDELFFLCAKPDVVEEFILTKTKNLNVHIMNKQSILRCLPQLLESIKND